MKAARECRTPQRCRECGTTQAPQGFGVRHSCAALRRVEEPANSAQTGRCASRNKTAECCVVL